MYDTNPILIESVCSIVVTSFSVAFRTDPCTVLVLGPMISDKAFLQFVLVDVWLPERESALGTFYLGLGHYFRGLGFLFGTFTVFTESEYTHVITNSQYPGQ